MLSNKQSPQTRSRRWGLEYAEGHYYIIDPDGVRVQKTLPVAQTDRWRVDKRGEYYCAVDLNGNRVPDSGILKEYQIVELLSFGGSSLCYKAVNRNTGRIVVIKELYPYALAKRGLIYRDGVEIREKPGLNSRDHERVISTFEHGFSQEQEANDSVRFYQEETGVTNDPRFLSSSPIAFDGEPGTLNQYQVIDTQAGTFLDKVVFNSERRKRVIDELTLLKQLLISIRVLHNERKRVHLDLKPENILVSKVHVNEEEEWGNHPVILIDFGSSIPVNDEGRVIVENDEITLTSTVSYAAPEVKNAAMDLDYSAIGVWSDLYSFFVIAQNLLLSDAGGLTEDNLSCESIRSSKSVGVLADAEQQLLVSFLRNGLETRKTDTADKGIKELDTIIDVLNNQGIHPIIIRKNAERKAKLIRETEKIDDALLCEVEITK